MAMPRLWKYLLKSYLQVFFLSVTGFIAILLVTRFQHIARFASMGASPWVLLKFISYQIPFILPLAIPISCLISSLLLFQRLSRSHELTALRVAGLGIFPIAFPLFLVSLFIGMANFTLASELAPKCKNLSKSLAYQMTAVNPLALLQKETLIKLKNTYIDLKVLKSGQYAEDVFFVTRNAPNQRLNLTLVKNLSLDGDKLLGSQVSFLSTVDSKTPEAFDHLIIENQEEMQTASDQLLQYLRNNDWSFSTDHLSLRLLQAKYHLENRDKIDPAIYQELARRASLAIAAFTFTLVGIAFGMEISRKVRRRGLLFASSSMILYLICFIAAKSIRHDPSVSTMLYLAPHATIILFSFYALKQRIRGWE